MDEKKIIENMLKYERDFTNIALEFRSVDSRFALLKDVINANADRVSALKKSEKIIRKDITRIGLLSAVGITVLYFGYKKLKKEIDSLKVGMDDIDEESDETIIDFKEVKNEGKTTKDSK